MARSDASVLDAAFSELMRVPPFDETGAHKIAAVFIAAGFDRALVRSKLTEARATYLYLSESIFDIERFVYEEAIRRPASLDEADGVAYRSFCAGPAGARALALLGDEQARLFFSAQRSSVVSRIRAPPLRR